MDSHGIKDFESFKDHGKDVSGSRSSIIQGQESVPDFSLQHDAVESDAKKNSVNQHDEPEKSYIGMALDKDSTYQNMAKTENLDPESSRDEAGHSDYEHSVSQCHHSPNSAHIDEGMRQCQGECNTEDGDLVLQISRTKGSDSSLIEKDERKSCVLNEQTSNMNLCGTMSPQSVATDNNQKGDSDFMNREEGKYFYYETPLYEETGIWIPVSVPPMTDKEYEEWTRGLCSNGGYVPGENMSWGQCIEEDKELTMWDVVMEMLLVARGKVATLASGDIGQVSWISTQLIEQAWKEMAQTLTEANFSNTQEILESEPPKWLPDSAASSCMLCSVRFHPIMCTRHHCRFCGGIFCSDCTKGRSLLPKNFRTGDPQRVCDVCCVRLQSVQPYLMDQVSRAAQLPTHDLTDLSTLRSWVNFPWGQSMEYEIYKATNTIRGYATVGSLRPEKRIPEAILRDAKGLAILTVAKVGMVVTYNIGTGLVVALREDGSWSPPSAISTFGVGWGAQAGGELTDFIIVLRTNEAVKTFCSDAHFSIGAGLSAAVGIIGRTAEADMRAGPSGFAACYTYSCSKGAFVGCSLEGSVVTTRARENSRFYGSQSINASDILLGTLPRPPAAATLYRALGDLYMQLRR
ncbi:SH3 domain-containing protein [Sesamum alatum]|uniref:SH3 domain-containing protein n=1 Tax=Sesamum alatum TaxID=300844 RepID=A0AAE2CZF3_9LAMI|nr:SH3 domain-containing protein [Sesamum alatum]